jgi:hypothetical protein
MEEFFHVLQTGFVYLQVSNKRRIKSGDELFCDYHGDLWFELSTSEQHLGDESGTETGSTQTPFPTTCKFQDAREL